MIDYEKLKLAHELAEKIDYRLDINIHVNSIISNRYELFKYRGHTCIYNEAFYSIDEVLAKLEELTQTKPKYEMGQVVWYLDEANFMTQPKPRSLVITEENINRYWVDDEFYPSREALVQSQIEYWQSQLTDSIKPGQMGTFGRIEAYPASKPPTKIFIPKEVMNQFELLTPEMLSNITCEKWQKCDQCQQIIFGPFDCPCKQQQECQHEGNDSSYFLSGNLSDLF